MDIVIAASKADRAACLRLRHLVFVEEQGVSEAIEFDGLDDACVHVLAREGGEPVATARIKYLDGVAKIQRVCVIAPRRGTGAGAAVMDFVLAEVRRSGRAKTARLGAQVHALGFYLGLGFAVMGEEYLEAGIPHRDMELPL